MKMYYLATPKNSPPPNSLRLFSGIKMIRILLEIPATGLLRGKSQQKRRGKKLLYIAQQPVTQKQWEEVMEISFQKLMQGRLDANYINALNDLRDPMTNVTYDEANGFCKKLAELETENAILKKLRKQNFLIRIPSNAEWKAVAFYNSLVFDDFLDKSDAIKRRNSIHWNWTQSFHAVIAGIGDTEIYSREKDTNEPFKEWCCDKSGAGTDLDDENESSEDEEIQNRSTIRLYPYGESIFIRDKTKADVTLGFRPILEIF